LKRCDYFKVLGIMGRINSLWKKPPKPLYNGDLVREEITTSSEEKVICREELPPQVRSTAYGEKSYHQKQGRAHMERRKDIRLLLRRGYQSESESNTIPCNFLWETRVSRLAILIPIMCGFLLMLFRFNDWISLRIPSVCLSMLLSSLLFWVLLNNNFFLTFSLLFLLL
jgi:hypothetical protein